MSISYALKNLMCHSLERTLWGRTNVGSKTCTAFGSGLRLLGAFPQHQMAIFLHHLVTYDDFIHKTFQLYFKCSFGILSVRLFNCGWLDNKKSNRINIHESVINIEPYKQHKKETFEYLNELQLGAEKLIHSYGFLNMLTLLLKWVASFAAMLPSADTGWNEMEVSQHVDFIIAP
ncbi:hypothetical protein YC2023_046284 [Brassica napus]